MVQRRKALQAWAALSCGYFGRSPDHLASSLVGQLMGIDVFRRHSAERAKAFADYFDYARKNDLFLTYVIINPQAHRAKASDEQAEPFVARLVDEDTGGSPSVAPKCSAPPRSWQTRCSSPTAAAHRGRRKAGVLVRPADERQGSARAVAQIVRAARGVVDDNPVSTRFDENDAVLYFDDVKVPWERLFVNQTRRCA